MAVTRRSFLTTAALAGAGGIAHARAQAPAQAPISPVPTPRDSRAASRSSIPTRTSSRSTTASAATSSATRRSSGCTPARCGPKARRGTASAGIWCGATSRTTSRCAGSKKTAASPCSAIRPATATATRSTSKAGSSPASTAAGASCATSTNGTVTVIAEKFQGKRLNSPNDVVGASGRRHLVHRSDVRHPRQLRRVQERVRRRRKRSTASTARRGRSTRSPTSQSGPNGICFSPDYKKLYVADTGMGRATSRVYDVDGKSLRNGKRFVAARHSRHGRALGGRRHPLRRRRQHLGRRAAGRAGDRAGRRHASA